MPELVKNDAGVWEGFPAVNLDTEYGEISLELGDPNAAEFSAYLFFCSSEDSPLSFSDQGFYIKVRSTEELDALMRFVSGLKDSMTRFANENASDQDVVDACVRLIGLQFTIIET